MPLLTPKASADLASSVRSAVGEFRAKRELYVLAFAVIAVGFAVVAFFKLEREVTDIPLLLFAGALHATGYVGLYLMLWPFVIAKLVYESTMDQLVERWFKREAQRRPEHSFGLSNVAYWRSILTAGLVALVTLTALAAPVIAIFFALPLQFDALAEILYAMLPSRP